MEPGSVRFLFEQKLQQKLEAVFNSISSIERITFLQFRDIQTYESGIDSKDPCSKNKKCIIADVQLTLQQVGPMNNGKSLEESTELGLQIAQAATREVLMEFGKHHRHKRKIDQPSELVVEVSHPITPIADIPALYVLTSVCGLGCIAAVIIHFWAYLKTFHQAHKMMWNHAQGMLGRIKVINNCVILALGVISVVSESLSCRDYVLGKRKESRLFSIEKMS